MKPTTKPNIDLSKIEIKDIPAKLANKLICDNHYSGTVAKGVQFHLGIFYDNTLYGVAQFGYGIKPTQTCKWVNDTLPIEYLELNRLWISDELGMNSESKAISLSLKYVKQRKPELKWIISFADGMMGKVGTIYQATNFVYTGFRKDGGIWMTKNGERLHSISLWHRHGTIQRSVLEGIYGTPLYKVFGGQYRYFHFYDKKLIKKLNVPILAYPKVDTIINDLDVKTQYGTNDGGTNYTDFKKVLEHSLSDGTNFYKKQKTKQEEILSKFI
jgi:hypothetical protein